MASTSRSISAFLPIRSARMPEGQCTVIGLSFGDKTFRIWTGSALPFTVVVSKASKLNLPSAWRYVSGPTRISTILA